MPQLILFPMSVTSSTLRDSRSSFDESGFDRAQLEAAMSMSWEESLASTTTISGSRITVGGGVGVGGITRRRRRQIRCSTCGDLGHNRRTCLQREGSIMSRRTRPMTTVEEFPTVEDPSPSVSDELEMTGQDCPICLEGISKADARAKPCGHVFHIRCMDAWSRLNPTCAVCKNWKFFFYIPTDLIVPFWNE